MTDKTKASIDFMAAITTAMEAHYKYLEPLTPEQEHLVERYGHFAHSYIADRVAEMIEESLTEEGVDKYF